MLSTEQDLGTIKCEILGLMVKNMKKVQGNVCALNPRDETSYISRTITHIDAFSTGHEYHITGRRNAISLYVTSQKITANETVK